MRKLIIMLTLLSAVSCVNHDIGEVLLKRDEISLTIDGVEQFVYDPLTCQLAHNEKTDEFRVFDERLSGWFILKCDEKPTSEGQKVKANLSCSTAKGKKSFRDLTFSVEKTDEIGKIWMWCQDKSIGIVIKNL